MSASDRVTRVAAYALAVDDRRRILLCRMGPGQPGEGKWTLPGGGLDFGEDPEAGVRRELFEESGLSGEVAGIAGVTSRVVRVRRDGGDVEIHALGICYRVTITGGTLTDEDGGSTDTCAWLPVDDVRGLPHTHLVASGLEFLARHGG